MVTFAGSDPLSQTTSRLVDDKRRLLVYLLQGAIGNGVMELPLGVDSVEDLPVAELDRLDVAKLIDAVTVVKCQLEP